MAYKIQRLLWCNEGTSNKIWGYVTIGSDKRLYNFWGARGKRYTFKLYSSDDSYKLTKIGDDKENRKTGAYKPVDVNTVEDLIPDFHHDFSNQLAMAKLFDNFHGTRDVDGPR